MENTQKCGNCDGTGKLWADHKWSDGIGEVRTTCPDCDGVGTLSVAILLERLAAITAFTVDIMAESSDLKVKLRCVSDAFVALGHSENDWADGTDHRRYYRPEVYRKQLRGLLK